jgi:hypothetical protein
MNHRHLLLVLSGMVLVPAVGCGDWPWAMDNPNDPLRCDPQCQDPFICYNAACQYTPCAFNPCGYNGSCTSDERAQTYQCSCYQGWDGDRCDKCAAGYTGFPSCQVDPCYQMTCNGNGKCSSGRCRCAVGYSGTECDQCASGYWGYPDCQCECSAGELACDGRSSIKTCTGACSWTSRACVKDCQSNETASFCASSALYSTDRCYCSASSDAGVIEYYLTTSCSSSLSAAAYDVTRGGRLGDVVTLSTSSPFRGYLTCVPGHEICWGAWQGKSYWGCGPDCSQSCEDCCATCPSTGAVAKYPSHTLACQ